MAKSSTVITLPQMVDLALNSPEIGIVNFTVLHSLLHVIVQQLELSECNVEFRGSDSERLQNYISTAKPGPIITLTEYTVGPEGQETESKKKTSGKRKGDEKGKVDETQTEKHSDLQTVVVVEQSSKVTDKNLKPPHFSVALTQDHYEELQNDIQSLKEKVCELAELPGNLGLVDAIRSGKDKSPVLDMFQTLNLTKRMDATDQAMEKLGTMIEDLAKEQKGQGPLVEAEPMKSVHLDKLNQRVTAIENLLADPSRDFTKLAGSSPRGSLDDFIHGPSKEKAKEPSIILPDLSEGIDVLGIELAEMPVTEAMAMIQKELQRLRNICSNEFIQAMKDIELIKRSLSQKNDLPPDVRINQMEIRYTEVVEQLESLDTMFNNQIQLLQEQLANLEKDMGDIGNKVVMESVGNMGHTEQSTVDTFNRINQLQDELNAISETATKLWEEREGKETLIEAVQEQLELLKTIKADKEELDEALADKADACMVNRKVSHEQFEQTCAEMNKGIQEALNKLNHQESNWISTLNELQLEIRQKIDKNELEPLKEFINNKLKLVHDKLKSIASAKTESEAAGTKSKFLRNVNCISCDKDVIMRKEMEPSLYPKSAGMPAGKSMGPYLAYELDQLRKQQKCLGKGKNLNMFEQALLTGRSEKGEQDHICNRYCGGSHTVTSPQQRVTRLGHFLEQWGPEIAPAKDETIRGTDGKMYKGRDDEVLRKFAMEKAKEKDVVTKRDEAAQKEKAEFSKIVKGTDNEFIDKAASQIDGESTVQGSRPPLHPTFSRDMLRKSGKTSKGTNKYSEDGDADMENNEKE